MSEYIDSAMSPVYALRLYVWELLKKNDPNVWSESKYGGLIPIVPLGEKPELDHYGGPTIVYGYALSQMNSLPAIKDGSMTFVIHDQNFRRLTKTMNILQAALERKDEAARDVNKFTSQYSPHNDGNIPLAGLSFGYIAMGYTEGGLPEETEGGRQSATFNVRFQYFVDYSVITDVTS